MEKCIIRFSITHEGGVGYAENIFETIRTALTLCHSIIKECDCSSGCPACVPPLPPGVDDQELEEFLILSNAAIECTVSLLVALLEGKIQIPRVKFEKHKNNNRIIPIPEDEALKKLNSRLSKAACMLRNKRERLH